MTTGNRIAILLMEAFLIVFLLAPGANAAEKLKGKVAGIYKAQSTCKVAVGLLNIKKDSQSLCEKDAENKAGSILVVQGQDSKFAPENGQTVIFKIKGAGKTTGTMLMVLKDRLTKDDIGKMSGKGSLVFWRNGEKGQVYVIKTEKKVEPARDTIVKMILKKKAPRVEGC